MRAKKEMRDKPEGRRGLKEDPGERGTELWENSKTWRKRQASTKGSCSGPWKSGAQQREPKAKSKRSRRGRQREI